MADDALSSGEGLTPEQSLERQIRETPGDIRAYLQLAELYQNGERWEAARTVYAQALEVLGEDADSREKVEDLQVYVFEQLIHAAKVKAKAELTNQAAKALYQRLKRELNTFELDMYHRRTERRPEEKGLWAEYALRLQTEGAQPTAEGANFFKRAIRAYQRALGDEARQGMILFGLAYCCQAEKQYPQAMRHYQEADTVVPNSAKDLKKEILYAAGRLAMQMRNLDVAREYLRRLSELD